jgi:hypothetical protein
MKLVLNPVADKMARRVIRDLPYEINVGGDVRRLGSETPIKKCGGGKSVRLSCNGRKFTLNVELLLEEVFTPKAAWTCYTKVEQLRTILPHLSDQLEACYQVSPARRRYLLIIRWPEVVKYWDPSNPQDVGLVFAHSTDIYKWLCNTCKGDWVRSPKGMLYGTKCPHCYQEEQREKGINDITYGNALEQELCRIFRRHQVIANHVGCDSNPIFDLFISHQDLVSRGIQCKAIYGPRGPSGVVTMRVRRQGGDTYPPSTLLVGLNLRHGLYIAVFSHYVDTVGFIKIALTSRNKSKYGHLLQTNQQEFETRLISLSREAVDVSTVGILRNKYYQAEHDTKLALRKLGYDVTDPELSVGDVDCYLTEHRIAVQLKHSSVIPSLGVAYVCLSRSVNGQRIPYSTDCKFRLLIIQLACASKDFLVIPKEVLMKYEYLSNGKSSGKCKIYVPVPENKHHFLSEYWNRFDLVSNDPYTPPHDYLDLLVTNYTDAGYSACVNRSNRAIKALYVNELAVHVTYSSSTYFRCMKNEALNYRPFCVEDGYQAFLFVATSGDYYLIPLAAMVERQYG